MRVSRCVVMDRCTSTTYVAPRTVSLLIVTVTPLRSHCIGATVTLRFAREASHPCLVASAMRVHFNGGVVVARQSHFGLTDRACPG